MTPTTTVEHLKTHMSFTAINMDLPSVKQEPDSREMTPESQTVNAEEQEDGVNSLHLSNPQNLY